MKDQKLRWDTGQGANMKLIPWTCFPDSCVIFIYKAQELHKWSDQ